jgi:hypothetical protein
MIDHWPDVDDHTHTPKVRVPMKQPRDTDEKWGLAIPPVAGARSIGSSGSIQHSDYRCGTP